MSFYALNVHGDYTPCKETDEGAVDFSKRKIIVSTICGLGKIQCNGDEEATRVKKEHYAKCKMCGDESRSYRRK